MKIYKRVLALIVSIVIVITASGICTLSADTPAELVSNGDLETDLSGWTSLGGSTIKASTDYAHKGSKSLLIFPWSMGANIIVSLEQNKEYELTFWHYSESGLANASVRIYSNWSGYISGGDILAEKKLGNDSSWTKYTYTFTSNFSGDATLNLGNDINCKSFFDEISLKEVVGGTTPEPDAPDTPEVDDDELIFDSGFENAFVNDSAKGWVNTAGGFLVTTDIFEGSQALRIPDWKEGVHTAVTLEKDVEYTLSFYHKGAAGATVDISSSWTNHVGRTPDVLAINTVANDLEYKLYTITFTSDYSGTAELWLTNQTGGIGSYFDNVSLKKSNNISEEEPELPPEIPSGELIFDGGFENAFVSDSTKGWVNTAGGILVTTDILEGSQALRIPDWKEGVHTSVILQKDVEYTLSFYHKGSAGATVDISSDWDNHINRTPDVLSINTVYKDAGYEKYTIVFVSPVTGTAELWFTNQAGGTGSYFDKVSLMKSSEVVPETPPTAEDNVELVADPDFEEGFKDDSKNGWANLAGGQIVNDPFLTGKHSLKIVDWAEGVNTKVYLVKGVEYRLTLYHKGVGGATVDISSDFANHINRTPDIMELKTLNNDDDFNKYTFIFVSSVTGYADLWLTNQVGGIGSYFDRVSLMTSASEEVDFGKDIDPNTELIVDPSFENGFVSSSADGWLKTSNADEEITNVYEGEKSVRLLDWSQGIRTLVTLQKGVEYELSFYHKGLAGATVDISTTWMAHSENPDVLPKFKVEKDDIFIKYTVIFTSTKNGSASIYVENQVGGTGSYFDKFSLKKRGELTFGSDIISIAETEKDSISVKWNDVKQLTGEKKDVTYYVYSSDERITESNIENLTPFAIVKGDEELKAKASELPENKSLYFAVVAEDNARNKAMILAPRSFRTKVEVKIINGDFETNDLTGWSNYSGKQAATSPNVVHGGKYALNLKDWATGVAQTVAVNPSTEYVLSFYAYNPAGSMKVRFMEAWDIDYIDPIEIEDHYEFKKYSVRFTTGPEMFSIIVNMSNSITYEYGFFDDFYIAELTNKDLYFDSGLTVLPGARYITYNFNPVISTKGGVTYQLYRDTKPFTEADIANMEPIEEFYDVTEYVDERDRDVENDVTYYYAVKATDSIGDTAYIFSSGVQKIFYEASDVPEEEEDSSKIDDAVENESEEEPTEDDVEEDSSNENDSKEENSDEEDTSVDDSEDEYFDDDYSDEEDSDEEDDDFEEDDFSYELDDSDDEVEYEIKIERRPVKKKRLKTTTRYVVHNYTWIVVVSIISGVLVAGGIIFFILWKKGIIKRKKVVKKNG